MQAMFLSLDADASTSEAQPALETPRKTPRGAGRAPADEQQDVPYALLSPRSRRKRRNRDQMRLVRRKERETMDKLRATVERLETRYRDMASAASDARGADETQQYAQLMAAASRLKDENFRLRHALDDKFKLQETLERVYTDCLASEEGVDASNASLRDASRLRQRQEDEQLEHEPFTPLSSAYVMARVRGTFTQAAAIRETLARRAAREHAPFFGWRVRLQSHAHWLLFAFDKPFPQATALDAMQQMWDRERGMHSYRSASELAHQTMRIVQHVNDDTYVFQRRLCPDTDPLYPSGAVATSPVVSTYLRFRLKTPTGFAIGLTTVAPTVAMRRDSNSSSSDSGDGDGDQDAEQEQDGAHDVWGADLCLWTEFEAVPSPYGREYCVARISGRTNVRNAAFHHRAAADCVIGLLRWESANMGPMFTFAS